MLFKPALGEVQGNAHPPQPRPPATQPLKPKPNTMCQTLIYISEHPF